MSTDSVCSKLIYAIVPRLYYYNCIDVGNNIEDMPSYDELLHMLNLKTLSMTIVWQ